MSEERELDRRERIQISKKLVKARKILRSIRGIFTVFGIGLAIWAVNLFLLGDAVPSIFKVVFVVQALLLLAGAVFLYAAPLAFTILLVITFTISSTAIAASDGFTIGFLVHFFTMIAACCAIAPIAKVTRTLQEHPELADRDQLKRRARTDAPTARALERSDERRAGQLQSNIRVIATVGAIAVIATVVVIVWKSSNPAASAASTTEAPLTEAEIAARESKLGPKLAEFRAAWSRSDMKWLEDNFVESRILTTWPKVKRVIEKRGWVGALPELDRGFEQRRIGEDSQAVTFDLAVKGQLKTRWEYESDAWRIARVVFSRTR